MAYTDLVFDKNERYRFNEKIVFFKNQLRYNFCRYQKLEVQAGEEQMRYKYNLRNDAAAEWAKNSLQESEDALGWEE